MLYIVTALLWFITAGWVEILGIILVVFVVFIAIVAFINL